MFEGWTQDAYSLYILAKLLGKQTGRAAPHGGPAPALVSALVFQRQTGVQFRTPGQLLPPHD
jgi:hypothetical protein